MVSKLTQKVAAGSQYVDYTKNQWASSADASVTLHCIYDPDTEQYTMEYLYYIVDFYDYSAYELLYEEDALGFARSYELFGRCQGTYVWLSGKKGWIFLSEV